MAWLYCQNNNKVSSMQRRYSAGANSGGSLLTIYVNYERLNLAYPKHDVVTELVTTSDLGAKLDCNFLQMIRYMFSRKTK